MDIQNIGSLHSRGTIFQYFCQGESHPSKLLLRKGKVNKAVTDVCKQREVRIAPSFWVDNETNIMTPWTNSDPWTGILFEEILSPFFTSNNLNPTWYYDETVETVDEDTGLWTGRIGLVSLFAKENMVVHSVTKILTSF